MKNLLFSFILMFLPLLVNAGVIEINGIYYNLNHETKQAEVTVSPNLYSGNIDIPERILYENDTYSVTSVGEKAFLNCIDLSAVTIPNSVTSIGRYSFRNCGLISIDIPSSVDSIGYASFAYCTSLNTVKIEEGITSFGDYSFYKCEKISSIIIPNTIVEIGRYVFYNCTKLKNVYFPSSITTIGYNAFGKCAIETLDLPNSVVKIDSWAFSNCRELKTITIPPSLREVGAAAFQGCYYIEAVYISDLDAWCRITFEGPTCNPFYSDYATLYLNNKPLYDLVIPETITIIPDYSFQRVRQIRSVTFHNQVKKIGYNAFDNCINLTNLFIPESVEQIDASFVGCENLRSIKVDNNNKVYDSQKDCNAIIKDDTLVVGCMSTKIPHSVKAIGYSAFYGHHGLTNIEIPDKVNYIGTLAFCECWYLTKIDLPEEVTFIGGSAFRGCTNLESINIPDKVSVIGNSAFAFCGKIESIKLPSKINTINNAAFECTNLTSIVIPANVKTIDSFAFDSCPLKEINISAQIDSIGNCAFGSCSRLERIYCKSLKIPSTHIEAFKDSNMDATLYVPSASLDIYKTRSLGAILRQLSLFRTIQTSTTLNTQSQILIHITQ